MLRRYTAALAEGRSFHSTVGCGGTETGYPINDRAVSVANHKVHNDLAVDQNQEASSIAMSSLRSRESAPLINFAVSCNVYYLRRQRYRRLALDAAHGAPCCISTAFGTCTDISVPSKVQPGSSTEVMEMDRDVPEDLLSALVLASMLWARLSTACIII